jgi:tetratricopeptide (TPR) repeat protein
MAERQGDFRAATEFAEQAMRLAREVGDRTTAAEALDSLSSVAQERGETELADSLLEACLAEWRASPAVRGVVSSFAGALGEVGWKAAWRADYPEAAQYFNEALVAAGELGIGRARSYALLGLAAVAEAEGRLEDARQRVADAALISERLGDRRFLGVEAYMRGLLAWDEGDLYGAEVGFLAALHEATESGYQILGIRSLEGMARVAGGDGRLPRAATLFGAAASLRAMLPWPVAPADLRWYERTTTRIRDALGAPLYDRAWSEGQALTFEEAVRVARDRPTRETAGDRCPG